MKDWRATATCHTNWMAYNPVSPFCKGKSTTALNRSTNYSRLSTEIAIPLRILNLRDHFPGPLLMCSRPDFGTRGQGRLPMDLAARRVYSAAPAITKLE